MSHLASSLLRCTRSSLRTTRPVFHSFTTRSIQGVSAVAQDPHTTNNTASPPPGTPTTTTSKTTGPQPSRPETIDSLIAELPLVQSLRQDPTYTESRPHLAMNPTHRPAHFVAGTLSGPNKITVPPFMWCATQRHAPSGRHHSQVVSVFHIGAQLCGHPGFVHGGLLTVMFDESFARCVSTSFPSGSGMTANLNVDFRKPALPDRLYVLQAETVKVEGRKAWVEGSLTSLPRRDEKGVDSVVVAEARALFVEPKFAKSMVPLYRQ
ncbi:HotDog domain-containing protein [Aspergillus ambiguus]|uniref:PaaI family thioesterase n=1 Tax=Aspergillus ambiguus TaxID=176160 RepID=UPI003CCD7E41